MRRFSPILAAGTLLLALCPIALSPVLSHTAAYAASCSGSTCDYQDVGSFQCYGGGIGPDYSAIIMDGGGNQQGVISMYGTNPGCNAYYGNTYSSIYTSEIDVTLNRTDGATTTSYSPLGSPQQSANVQSLMLGRTGPQLQACGTVYNSSHSTSWSNCTVYAV